MIRLHFSEPTLLNCINVTIFYLLNHVKFCSLFLQILADESYGDKLRFDYYLIFLHSSDRDCKSIKWSKVKHLDTEQNSEKGKSWVTNFGVTEDWHRDIVFSE